MLGTCNQMHVGKSGFSQGEHFSPSRILGAFSTQTKGYYYCPPPPKGAGNSTQHSQTSSSQNPSVRASLLGMLFLGTHLGSPNTKVRAHCQSPRVRDMSTVALQGAKLTRLSPYAVSLFLTRMFRKSWAQPALHHGWKDHEAQQVQGTQHVTWEVGPKTHMFSLKLQISLEFSPVYWGFRLLLLNTLEREPQT